MQSDSAENERRRIEGSYRYVAHGAIKEYEACGWVVIDRMEDLHHGDHGVLMKHVDTSNMTLGAYDAIPAFERALAEYTGAPFATTVDSCTNALFLCLKYMRAHDDVSIPKFTYHSVPMAIINAGCNVRFDSRQWLGAYRLDPYPLWDAARRFTSNMYKGGFWCVSFHSSKILGDTQGGAILHSDPGARAWFEEAQFDGRKRGTTAKTWTPRMIGWHCRMSPDIATRLHQALAYLPKDNADLPNDEYADLSSWEIFK